MMTRAEYIESLRRLNLKVYFMGELIENPVDHPMIRPSMNSVAKLMNWLKNRNIRI